MSKRILLAVFAAVISAVYIFPSPSVYAYGSGQYVPLCTSTYLDTWNWDVVAQSYTNNASFNRVTSSYVMVKTMSSASVSRTATGGSYAGQTAPSNVYDVYWTNDSTNHATIDVNASDGVVHLRDSVSPFKHFQLISEPASQNPVWGNYWSGFGNGTNATDSGSFSQFDYAISDAANTNCMSNTVNFLYGPNWGYNHFSTAPITAGTGSATACKITDLGCLFNRLGDTLANELSSVSLAVAHAIGAVFVPDTAMMQGDFSDFNTFIQAKLGFLVFPITFLVNTFNAFTGTGSSCTDSSCVKTFGNLFGHSASINLSAVSQTMPTLWSWFTALTRGLIVVELGLMLARKYREIVRA